MRILHQMVLLSNTCIFDLIFGLSLLDFGKASKSHIFEFDQVSHFVKTQEEGR